MIKFRDETSFPFLKLAREAGVPYAKVLHIAEVIENGETPTGSTARDPLVKLIVSAVTVERWRRERLRTETNQ